MAWEVQTASPEETVNHLQPTDTVAIQEFFFKHRREGSDTEKAENQRKTQEGQQYEC